MASVNTWSSIGGPHDIGPAAGVTLPLTRELTMSLQGPVPEEPRSPSARSDQLRRFGLPALLGVLGLIFILQNLDTISVKFLWMDFDAQLWLLLVIFGCIGAVVFWGVQRRRAARRRAREA